MWRTAVIIVSVLIVDFLLFFVVWGITLEANMVELAHAYAAHGDNPTPETQRVLNAAQRKAEEIQFKARGCATIAILMITSGGFFFAGRQFERRKTKTQRSASPGHVPLHT